MTGQNYEEYSVVTVLPFGHVIHIHEQSAYSIDQPAIMLNQLLASLHAYVIAGENKLVKMNNFMGRGLQLNSVHIPGHVLWRQQQRAAHLN